MKDENTMDLDLSTPEDLTSWENPPKLEDLKQDYTEAQSAHTDHTVEVDKWLSNLNGDQQIKAKKVGLKLYLSLYVSKLSGVTLH